MTSRIRQSVDWRSLRPVILLVALALIAVGAWHFLARPSRLPAGEVQGLLSEHTAKGAWPSGVPYLIWFGPEGRSLHGGPERETAEGRWQVADDGRVCFALAGQEEACYGVGRESGSLVWILEGSGRTYPFALREGRDPAL